MSDSNDDLNDLDVVPEKLKEQWKAQWDREEYAPMAKSIITTLKTYESDSVRDALKEFRNVFTTITQELSTVFQDDLIKIKDEKAKLDYVYNVPFFCCPLKEKNTAMFMSSLVTKIDRASLKKFMQFQIHFDVDDGLTSKASESDPVIHKDINDERYIANMLMLNLIASFKISVEDDEGAQKNKIIDILKPMLNLCGYDGKSFSEPDFAFVKQPTKKEEDKKSVIWGEAKQLKNLPQTPIGGQLNAHLCRYGFATLIARHRYDGDSLHVQRLQNLLNISGKNISTKGDAGKSTSMSLMIKDLLSFSDVSLDNPINDRFHVYEELNRDTGRCDIQTKMIESAKTVRSELQKNTIGSKDALSLWGATMQACSVSVSKRRKFTVVMSARIMWFVRLDIKNHVECTVLFSDSILIGAPGFTQKVIDFIMLADDSDKLLQNDIEKWEAHFNDNSKNDKKGNGGNNNDRTTDQGSDADDDNDNDDNNDNKDQNKRQKIEGSNIVSNLLMTSKSRPPNNSRPRVVSTDNSSSLSKTAENPTQIIQPADGSTNKVVSPGPVAIEMGNAIKSIGTKSKGTKMTDEEQMMWQRAFTGLGNADMKYLDQDQDGVIIPYLCQLEGAEVESLGNGRCGTVKKIRWNNNFAAMKEYVLQHEDDPRIPSDVYEHELEVFYRLKSLWGQYVPRLLFHNPWSCCPSIGMEVGVPMDYDFEKWDEADKEKMRETIDKIEEKGFKQDDCRAANFVRLDNGSIAMIDFEAVVEISP